MDENVVKTTSSLVDNDDEDPLFKGKDGKVDALFSFEEEEEKKKDDGVFSEEEEKVEISKRTLRQKDKVNVKVVRCKVYKCDGICGNKYQIRSKTCRACLNAKEVYLERGDETPMRFCQKCTKFHATDMFEGGRKACKTSLKKVQEKNRVIFAKQRMMMNEIRKIEFLRPHSMDSVHSLVIEEECEKMNATAAAAPMKMITTTTTTTTTSDVLQPAVDRLDRLVEAIKSKKRKESLLDLPLINGNAFHETKVTKMLKFAEEEEEEEEEGEGKDDDVPTEKEEEEADDGDDVRIKNSSNDDKSGSKPLMNKLISMVQNAARSVTPLLYREAMKIKLNEFFESPSSSLP